MPINSNQITNQLQPYLVAKLANHEISQLINQRLSLIVNQLIDGGYSQIATQRIILIDFYNEQFAQYEMAVPNDQLKAYQAASQIYQQKAHHEIDHLFETGTFSDRQMVAQIDQRLNHLAINLQQPYDAHYNTRANRFREIAIHWERHVYSQLAR